MLEAHVRTDVVVLVSLREDLGAELAAQISVRGQLRDQDALVVAGHTVGGVGRHIPTAAEGAVMTKLLPASNSSGHVPGHRDGRNEGRVLFTGSSGPSKPRVMYESYAQAGTASNAMSLNMAGVAAPSGCW